MILLIVIDILIGSATAKGSSTLGLIDPGDGIIFSSKIALLTSIAIFITDEYISNI